MNAGVEAEQAGKRKLHSPGPLRADQEREAADHLEERAHHQAPPHHLHQTLQRIRQVVNEQNESSVCFCSGQQRFISSLFSVNLFLHAYSFIIYIFPQNKKKRERTKATDLNSYLCFPVEEHSHRHEEGQGRRANDGH